MATAIIVYLPVIHQGYLKLFKKHPRANIYIINQEVIKLIDKEFDYLRKEIRSITPQQAITSLQALLPKRQIELLNYRQLSQLNQQKQQLILPSEDIFVWLAKNHLDKAKVTFETTFLRWNRKNTVEKTKPTPETSKKLEQISQLVELDAQLSPDWWRQVGSVIFEEQSKKIIAIAHNQHLPSPYTPYIDSDPRNSFHKGENIDLSTAIHAEAAVIAYCAKEGIALANKSIYVSTFPCPVCAKQIACSGISKLYYKDGYSMLNGETILKSSGVQIQQIK